jgi:hypothetical protein
MKKWATAERLPKDHVLWGRLSGKSEYCQHKFFADKQARNVQKDYDHFRDGCRYTVINYCYGRQQTIECRLLPMFKDVAQSIRALQEVIAITNAFLVANKSKEPRYVAAVPLEDDILHEEIIECVS